VRQFDVCPNPSERSRSYAPFVVDLQSHYLEAMPTTVVAPMLSRTNKGYTVVGVEVSFNEEPYSISVVELASIATATLKVIGNLAENDFEIRRALDRLFTGF
jgi:hypothetical protein